MEEVHRVLGTWRLRFRTKLESTEVQRGGGYAAKQSVCVIISSMSRGKICRLTAIALCVPQKTPDYHNELQVVMFVKLEAITN